MADSLKIKFIETSAKNSENVEKTIINLAIEIMCRLD
jgi:hypothetical protein